MVNTEPIPEKNTREVWEPIGHCKPDGYYLTLNAAGLPYNDAVGFNTGGIEEILRTSSLPPVHITSKPWKPNSTMDFEGADVLSMKEVGFMSKIPRFNLDKFDLELGIQKPVGSGYSPGWEMRIKTQKISHDIDIAYPRATKTEKLQHFYWNWESRVRLGLFGISLLESTGMREQDENHRHLNFAKRSYLDLLFSTLQLIQFDESISSPESLLKFIGLGEAKGFSELFQKKYGSIHDTKIESNRKDMYPERFKTEKSGSPIRFASRLIPGMTAFEPTVLTITALTSNPQILKPFTRVPSQI